MRYQLHPSLSLSLFLSLLSFVGCERDDFLTHQLATGHINFSDEVTASFRMADGVVVVVDVVEGVMMQTERIIKHAMQEGLPMTIMLSKVRRKKMVGERRMLRRNMCGCTSMFCVAAFIAHVVKRFFCSFTMWYYRWIDSLWSSSFLRRKRTTNCDTSLMKSTESSPRTPFLQKDPVRVHPYLRNHFYLYPEARRYFVYSDKRILSCFSFLN